ncbi:MAG TPA: hypothetical protein VFB46_17030 [Gemmatimonadaceae bacterium]|nr:hypothetical protein [Gemmatimonadaceae bacterium]
MCVPTKVGLLVAGAALASSCATTRVPASEQRMNAIAESYVKLVLAVGQHDPNYVDAYYGPPAWKASADSAKLPLDEILRRADAALAQLGDVPPERQDLPSLRARYLRTQLGALRARVRMLQGERFTFDEESKALYDAVAPTHDDAYFQRVIDTLARILPGTGPVPERMEAFRSAFVIPREKLDTVFSTAIEECERRTQRYLVLPPDERFTVEQVVDKPWSGYNWYQGRFRSLIQVNVELPIYIDRAVDLACHEGYPGHHVYNTLLEDHLVRERGWWEYSVYPLFSPQSLIAEGSANYGIEMAFPGSERVEYEKTVLFPLAGLDASRADAYYAVQELMRELTYAGNEAARRYLNGEITAAQAAEWLVRYALSSPERARQRVRFFDTYRSYVINYNLGQDLVKAYVERGATRGERWRRFGELLSTPRLPSDLAR